MSAQTATRYRVAQHVQRTIVDGTAIVMDGKQERYLGLNEVATRIFEHIERHGTLNGLQRALESDYQVDPETLRRDVEKMVGELESAGLIEALDG